MEKESAYAMNKEEIKERFIEMLPSRGDILDFGCGSGRDTVYFIKKGLKVTPMDSSRILCNIATESTGIKAVRLPYEDLDEVGRYDGIWTGASILHLGYQKLITVFYKIHRALKGNGVVFVSFKYGMLEGVRGGRPYTDMDEHKFEDLLEKVKGFRIEEMTVTPEVKGAETNGRWINIFLRKVD